MRQLRLASGDPGRWTLVHRKTRRYVTVRVSSGTLARLTELAQHSPSLLDIYSDRGWYSKSCRRITGRLGRSISPQMLRQSAASEIERQKPHTAWVALGHESLATTQTWYIDADAAYADIPRPTVEWGR